MVVRCVFAVPADERNVETILRPRGEALVTAFIRADIGYERGVYAEAFRRYRGISRIAHAIDELGRLIGDFIAEAHTDLFSGGVIMHGCVLERDERVVGDIAYTDEIISHGRSIA